MIVEQKITPPNPGKDQPWTLREIEVEGLYYRYDILGEADKSDPLNQRRTVVLVGEKERLVIYFNYDRYAK